VVKCCYLCKKIEAFGLFASIKKRNQLVIVHVGLRCAHKFLMKVVSKEIKGYNGFVTIEKILVRENTPEDIEPYLIKK